MLRIIRSISYNQLKVITLLALMMVDGALVWIIGESFNNIVRQGDEPLRLAE
jgi:hypothetical protein